MKAMSCRRFVFLCLCWGIWLGLLPGFCLAETRQPAPSTTDTLEGDAQEMHSAPVVVDGVILFRVRGTSAYPAATRARNIAGRIEALAADPAFSPASLALEHQATATLVRAGEVSIMTVADADARLERVDRQLLAQVIRQRVGEAIDGWRRDRNPQVLQRRALYALGATMLLVLALWIGHRLFRHLSVALEARFRARVHDLRFKSFQVVRAEQVCRLLNRAHGLLWMLVLLAGLYVYLHSVLSLFPWTRGLARDLFTFLLEPLRTLGLGLIKIVPKLLFLLVLFLVTRLVLKLLRLFFDGVATGAVVLPNFEAEWAWPTFRLVRLVLVAFAVIIAYPYIPGSETGVFKGISIFIGVLFSLGSSSLIGNLIAGYSMIYRRAFKAGDRVKIGECLGDVEQVRLLVTQLRTPKNEVVVIPNSTILGGEVVNYNTLAQKQGLILHTTVGIGYKTPWRQVEAMLLEAAVRTPGLLREPPPFVLLTALGDFCVTYEINVYCAEPQAMPRLYAELHRSVLDLFNEYGVQIMTPAYEGDPEQPKVVPKEQWYAAPARPPGGKPEG